MTVSASSPLESADTAFIRECFETVWQTDRIRTGEKLGTWVRPTYTGDDAVSGVTTCTLNVVQGDVPVYFRLVPEELIAQSGGVYQVGSLDVVVHGTGSGCDNRDLWYLDSRLHRILSQRYRSEYDELRMVVTPYSESTDSLSITFPVTGTPPAQVVVSNGKMYMYDVTDGLYHRVIPTGGILNLSPDDTLPAVISSGSLLTLTGVRLSGGYLYMLDPTDGKYHKVIQIGGILTLSEEVL